MQISIENNEYKVRKMLFSAAFRFLPRIRLLVGAVLVLLASSSNAQVNLLPTTRDIQQGNTQTSVNGLNVTNPNGYATITIDDMSVQSIAGPVKWTRNWDGQEWKFNPFWESLSQSWKNMTGSEAADTTGGTFGYGGESSSGSGSIGSGGCWVWVDEDWSPTINSGQASAMVPERMTPFNKVIGESGADYAAAVRVNLDYASLCPGTNVPSGGAEMEAIRRQSELYIGDGARYAFSNRAIIEKRAIQAIVAATPAALDAQLASGNISLSYTTIEKGYRWLHKDGNWIDYNTQGQVVSYGDRNNNKTWLVRDKTGTVRGVVDGYGRVLYTLHYTGALLTEVRDAPIAGNDLDLAVRSVRYQYDTINRLTQVTDVRGYTIKYDYDSANHIIKITDQEGRIEQITYKGSTVSKRIAPDGGVTDYVFEYDDTNKQFVSKITGPETVSGRRVEDYTHNRVGKLVRKVVNGRADEEVRYDAGMRTEVHTNARGFSTRIVRDEYDQIVQTEQPDGTTTKSAYSPLNLQMTEETDEEGFSTQYQYDGKGNLTKRIEAVGTTDERVTEYQINSLGQTIRMVRKGRAEVSGTVTLDAAWQTEYDASGQISKTIDPEGNVQQYVFNRIGRLIRLTDARGNNTQYEVDPQGNLVRTVDAIGRVLSYSYDKVGNQITRIDARGKATLEGYDAMNRHTQVTNPVAGQYKVQYNGQGLPVLTTDEDGRSTQIEYDNFLRVAKQIDALGNTIQFDYRLIDASSETGKIGSLWTPTEISYPTYVQQNWFDARERLVSQTIKYRNVTAEVSTTTSLSYDRRGLLTKEIDEDGNAVSHTYDALGRRVQLIDALGGKTIFTYDVNGNLLQFVDAKGNIYRYTYDLNNRVRQAAFPLGQTVYFVYDGVGNLVQRTDRENNKFIYSYDAVNRLVEVKKIKGDGTLLQTTEHIWDANNMLIAWSETDLVRQQIINGTATYDDANRKTGETISYPDPQGGTLSLSYKKMFSPAGKLTRLTWPDGTDIDYGWSAHGELASVTIPQEGTISVNQFKWVAPEKITLPGGSTQNKTYDGLLNLENIKVKTPGQQTTLDLSNHYGKFQELKQRERTDTIGEERGTKNSNYMYDGELRLRQAVLDSGGLFGTDTESFVLDLVGNRLADSRQADAWTYDANNRLIKRGDGVCGDIGTTICYDYDNAGNQTRKTESSKVTHYVYDAMNRLVEVKDKQDKLIARYGYDAQGRRAWKEQYRDQTGSPLIQALRTYYLYADEGLIAEATQRITLSAANIVTADESPQVAVQYGPQPESLFTTGILFIKTKDSNGKDIFAYYHQDHLNTPIQATDKDGKVVWAAEYTPFGKATIVTPTPTSNRPVITSNLRFPGQYEDVETGLHYNFHRYYDKETGRYVQSDPIELAGGANLYGYADQNPLLDIDPFGLVKVHGNWCGPDWTGGYTRPWDELTDAEKKKVKPPVDKTDEACKKHDICYGACRTGFPCYPDGRSTCFKKCDDELSKVGGPIGYVMKRPGKRDPGPNGINCAICR
jgi:RHS repeat-associated protein